MGNYEHLKCCNCKGTDYMCIRCLDEIAAKQKKIKKDKENQSKLKYNGLSIFTLSMFYLTWR